MTREDIEALYEDVVFADGYDDAIVGVASCRGETVVVYDATKIVDTLEADGMSRDDALEFFDFNIAGAYVGENTPAFLWTK